MKDLPRVHNPFLKPAFVAAGMDMGTTNTALCITQAHGPVVKILYADMVPPHILIRDFEEGSGYRIQELRRYLGALLDHYKPEVLVGELFFARSFRSNLGVPVNFMLGLIAGLCAERAIKFIAVNAGTWKGHAWLKQLTTVETLYRHNTINHMTDSFLMSLFARRDSLKNLREIDLINLGRALPRPKTNTTLRTPKKKPKTARSRPRAR